MKTYEERLEPLLNELRKKENQGKLLWYGDNIIGYSEMLTRILNGDPLGNSYAENWLNGTVPPNPSTETLEAMKKKRTRFLHVPLIEFLYNGGNMEEGRMTFGYWGLTTQMAEIGEFKDFQFDDDGDISGVMLKNNKCIPPDHCYIQVEATPIYK